jgi:hypothetical protein
MAHGSHSALFNAALAGAGGKPRAAFAYLFDSMNEVISFGRTAKFDFLTMIGKLGLSHIEAPSAYMQGATGPLKGARLLFSGKKDADVDWQTLDAWLLSLESFLQPGPQGMQVLEDALCNWQKSPTKFRPFRG